MIFVSKNRCTWKWMVKIRENPYEQMDDLGVTTHIFGNIQMIFVFISVQWFSGCNILVFEGGCFWKLDEPLLFFVELMFITGFFLFEKSVFMMIFKTLLLNKINLKKQKTHTHTLLSNNLRQKSKYFLCINSYMILHVWFMGQMMSMKRQLLTTKNR